MQPIAWTERRATGAESLHLERRASVPERGEQESGERAVVASGARVDELIASAAEACASGALETAADAYRQAAAIEARTGDLERALACLRMASSLRAEVVRAECLPKA